MNIRYINQFWVTLFISAAVASSQSSIFEAGGNVGIGASPSAGAKLSISGSVNNPTLLRLDGPGPGGGYYLNFADASIGGQGFGRAFLRWTRDNNLGRAFSIITSDDQGNSAERLIVDTHGSVGIGTGSPTSKLSVVGSYVDTNTPQLDVDGGPAGAVLTLSGGGIHRGKVRVDAGGGIALESSGVGGVAINYSGGSGDTTFWNGQGSGLMVIKHDGSVGIGTMAPTQKLSVNGSIRAKEVVVETAGWSDYVFTKNYVLASLSDVEQQIQKEGHLPGIPSAAEVAEKGVGLGEMQAKLLAKIEELTLHVIEQQKRIERLTEQNIELNNRVKVVEAR